MRIALADSIGIYPRYLSPRKGFSCAHNHLHGRGSCSAFGKRVVVKYGVLRFSQLLFLRFAECREASVISATEPSKNKDDKGLGVPGYCAIDAAVSTACCMFAF
jgi:putative component of membrane protein insertase Oxa1/YidC/SpoIIIJ protein YidD